MVVGIFWVVVGLFWVVESGGEYFFGCSGTRWVVVDGGTVSNNPRFS